MSECCLCLFIQASVTSAIINFICYEHFTGVFVCYIFALDVYILIGELCVCVCVCVVGVEGSVCVCVCVLSK